MKRKKKKVLRPATGYVTRGEGKNPHSAIFFHKGFVHDQLRHTVLTISQMSEVDQLKVQATLKTITTGPHAMTLPDGVNGWACVEWGFLKRVYVLSYRGIEVALFFQRQLSELKLNPGDRYPEGVMQDPAEAWQRLDLLGASAKKSNIVLASMHERLEQQNKLLTSRIETLESLNDQIETENKSLKSSRDSLTNKLKQLTRGGKHGKASSANGSNRTRARTRR